MKVIKRDGTKVDFDAGKIRAAVKAAYDSCEAKTGGDFDETLDKVVSDIVGQGKDPVSVEEIQDIVEKNLMEHGPEDVAKAYIVYRYQHELARNEKKQAEFDHVVDTKLMARDVQNQNANIDEMSFGGRMGEMSSEVMRQYALDHLVSPMARKNHLENRIYIHDLDHYALGDHNCLSVPFDKLLAKGFNTRQTDVRPANSVNTAFQLVAVIFQLQSLMEFGGVSATHLDWTMVPYVRKSFFKHYKEGLQYLSRVGDVEKFCKDNGLTNELSIEDEGYQKRPEAYRYAMDMTEKETRQASEGMFHNLNTLQSRSGNQLPFTSINYGTCTLPEGRMVIKSLLSVSIEGLGKLHRTSIFPCSIFQCMKGVNRKPGDINYDLFRLALRSTAQRLYPNYANVDWSGNEGYDRNDPKTYFSTMGCRTANGKDINGMGQTKDGRGNIAPVTIILPTLAMEAGQDVEKFMELLDKEIFEAKDMLLERFEWICSQSPESAKFMYENGTMEGYIPEEGIRSALRHGTLAIGQLGIAETLQLLVGCNQTDPKGMELAKRIEALIRQRCDEFKQQYKLNYCSYFTPAENLCYTALKKFKAKYGEIKNVSDKEFFTNSIHVPVWKKVTPFEKIDVESQLAPFANAGEICYVELSSTVKNNLDAIETIVNYAMDKDIPYFAINVPNDTCMTCGYTDELDNSCPECGGKNIQRLRRVTGYLTGNYTTAFNEGKQDEVRHRVKHM